MKCDKCVRKDYCPWIHQFNHDPNVGCIDFQDRDYTTYVSNTLNTGEERMNEEFKALEKIDHTICLAFNDNNKALFNKDNENHIDCQDIYEFFKCYEILETALNRLEEHDKIFKKYDINDNWLEPALYVIKNHFPMDTETQLKKLKALDVIKEKRVNACEIINSKDVREYNWSIHTPKKYPLTQEEFDILKEELK